VGARNFCGWGAGPYGEYLVGAAGTVVDWIADDFGGVAVLSVVEKEYGSK
jgi:hypothetical protein